MAWRVFDLSSIELRAEAEAKGQGYLVRFCLCIFSFWISQKSARRSENSTLQPENFSLVVLGFVSL